MKAIIRLLDFEEAEHPRGSGGKFVASAHRQTSMDDPDYQAKLSKALNSARKYMTADVLQHEDYILGMQDIKTGVVDRADNKRLLNKATREHWGDEEFARYEMLEGLSMGWEYPDDYLFDKVQEELGYISDKPKYPWFEALVARQAACNYFESGHDEEDKSELKGGAGSGNYGHAGRPGEVGGSAHDFSTQEGVQRWLRSVFKPEPDPKSLPIPKEFSKLTDAAKAAGLKDVPKIFVMTVPTPYTGRYNPNKHQIYIATQLMIDPAHPEYGLIDWPLSKQIKTLAHELGHAIDFAQHGLITPEWAGQWARETTADDMRNRLLTDAGYGEYINKEIEIEFKGGDGSGNFDHAGRPGLVGGSAPQRELTSEERIEWYNRINIATYDKMRGKRGARLGADHLSHMTENVIWADWTKQQFLDSLKEPDEPVPTAKKGNKYSVENFLYQLKNHADEMGGASAIEWREIQPISGLSEWEFDHYIYSGGLDKYFSWEHTHGLNQLRIKHDYTWSSRNGIQTIQTAAKYTLWTMGYYKPDGYYDFVQKLRPSQV